MKVLVLAENYSKPNGDKVLEYIHTRNKFYKKNNLDVVVLSFETKIDYVLDDIPVYREKHFTKKEIQLFDIVISHAPNLKNHMRFIYLNKKSIKEIVFFFHGHEVLDTVKEYPKPYNFQKSNFLKMFFRKKYDKLKLLCWKGITKAPFRKTYIFVSEWMKHKFVENTGVSENDLPRNLVIENCVGNCFLSETYDSNSPKLYDVVTIRNNLDGKKYAIDLVNYHAWNNPKLKFLVIGKGEFFRHVEKAPNIQLLDINLNHLEVIKYLNMTKSVYLPTRLDSQGVMACEIATFGTPLITSDISICREMLGTFENVQFVSNSLVNVDFEDLLMESTAGFNKNLKFSEESTVLREVKLLKELYNAS